MITPHLHQGSDVQAGFYRHFKGGEYIVVGVAEHSETGEKFVVYHEKNKEHDLKIRPLAMFEETVVVGGKTVQRFEKIDSSSQTL